MERRRTDSRKHIAAQKPIDLSFPQTNRPDLRLQTKRLQESSPALPAQPETPHDGHLAGLLTYASGELEAPSRVISPIHANIQGINRDVPSGLSFQVLSDYSCGAVADSHRSSHYQTEENLYESGRLGQGNL
jgi:hypothetical protein